MKNFILYFILAFSFISCNNNGAVEAHAIAVPQGSVKTDTGTITRSDTVTENSRVLKKIVQPLLIARGSEPGWYAEFYTDHLRLLIDNGTDSLILKDNFSNINSEKIVERNVIKTGKKKDDKKFIIGISITNKTCTEEGSGEKREKTISIKYNNKTYKGCATAQ